MIFPGTLLLKPNGKVRLRTNGALAIRIGGSIIITSSNFTPAPDGTFAFVSQANDLGGQFLRTFTFEGAHILGQQAGLPWYLDGYALEPGMPELDYSDSHLAGSGAWTQGSQDSGTTTDEQTDVINDTTKAWTPGQWINTLVKLLGRVYLIANNGVTTLSLYGTWPGVSVPAGTNYIIVAQAISVEADVK